MGQIKAFLNCNKTTSASTMFRGVQRATFWSQFLEVVPLNLILYQKKKISYKFVFLSIT